MAKNPTTFIHHDEGALNIHTDGSSRQAPRRGGYGYVFVDVDEDGNEVTFEVPGEGHVEATNNEMELLACVEALKLAAGRYCPVDLEGKSKIVIYTDSEYAAGGYKSAQSSWPANNWMTRDGNPVLHAEMWKELLKAAHKTGKRVEIHWAKGHSKANPHNRTADKLAKQSSGNAFKPPVTRVKVRRKLSEAVEVAGSVELHGQRMTVRIITSRYLKEQRMFHYKYEVLSKGQNRGCVDRIYSDHEMSAGHKYFVRVNDEVQRPRLVKVFREVE